MPIILIQNKINEQRESKIDKMKGLWKNIFKNKKTYINPKDFKNNKIAYKKDNNNTKFNK